jgi:hypothetical protein
VQLAVESLWRDEREVHVPRKCKGRHRKREDEAKSVTKVLGLAAGFPKWNRKKKAARKRPFYQVTEVVWKLLLLPAAAEGVVELHE